MAHLSVKAHKKGDKGHKIYVAARVYECMYTRIELSWLSQWQNMMTHKDWPQHATVTGPLKISKQLGHERAFVKRCSSASLALTSSACSSSGCKACTTQHNPDDRDAACGVWPRM